MGGFADIVKSGRNLISDLDGFGPVAGPDADQIYSAFQEVTRQMNPQDLAPGTRLY